MEHELYPLLNYFLNPKKFSFFLSLVLLLFMPALLEFLFIVHILKAFYGIQIMITLESLSVLIGYIYLLITIRIRIHRSLKKYEKKYIYRLVGSFPVMLYLLSPGFISLALGIILTFPVFSTLIGRKIIQVSNIDPGIIHTLLELNNAK